jgi:alpha-L-arabinofuranosidase
MNWRRGPVIHVQKRFLFAAFGLLLLPLVAAAETPREITVEADRPGAKINPALWGVFFEDINFGADGGLYAELVKNRGFEFPDAWMGWRKLIPTNAMGAVEIRDYDPFDTANPHYLRVFSGVFSKGVGVSNEGFRGMGIRKHATYRFSVQARAIAGRPALRIELVDAYGHRLGSARLREFTFRWKPYAAELRARGTDSRARLNLIVEGSGTLELDMVSLFPADTWKGRPNGLRADLVQKLAELEPGFVRFPGGCIVEGRDLANRYQWKNTIHDLADRRLIVNRWNTEFTNRLAPDYYQSFGLGFFEYFQLCEDIGAEPLPVLNCGMACQFNSGQLVPLDELSPYIQDALDLIEFANGPPTSEWGGRRAAMGHPGPFGLKILAIGNEQWGPEYIARYAKFAQAVKVKHPEIQLVAAGGPDSTGERFDFLWSQLRELKADLVDEHFYRPPEWFLSNVHRYDGYDRAGPRVFAGEYAAHVSGRANTLESALAEAAMMTGFERNADVVRLASYAPLLAHVDAWQWRPNLIWFDNLRVVATPDYYVQQLFSRNRGDRVLPVELSGSGSEPGTPERLFVSATRDVQAGEIILKVVNAGTNAVEARVRLNGLREARTKASQTVLTAASLQAENSLGNPNRVVPRTQTIKLRSSNFTRRFSPISLTVLRVRAKD